MKSFLPLLFFVVSTMALGQGISINKALEKDYKPKWSGGLQTSAAYNSVYPSNKLNYFLSGNLNLSINQFTMPILFNFSDRKFQFSQAYTFNQASFNPTYKWASASIGTTNSSFSQYSLNGHQYSGIGVNLSPNKWKIQAMSGRLLKSSESDSVNGPVFTRWGYGLKTNVQLSNQINTGVSFFYAKDITNSLPEQSRAFEGQPINPSENLVLGFNFDIRPVDFIEWKLEMHNSLLNTTNTDSLEAISLKSPASWFMKPKAGSRSYNAFKTDFNFRLSAIHSILGVGYEKVDPDYRTLGGYYFVNDIRNYTVNLGTNLWKQKWTLNARLGIQEDDIARTKSSQQRRFISSLSSNLQLGKGVQITSNYSNMQAYMFVRDAYQEITQVPGQPIDSLDYSQISQNFNSSIQKRFDTDINRKGQLSLNINLAKAEGRNGPVLREDTKSMITNFVLRYVVSFTNYNLDIGPSISFNQNKFIQGKSQGFGPSFFVNKSFLNKKAQAGFTTSLLFSERNGQKINAFNTYFNANYQPLKNHSIRLNAGLVSTTLASDYQNITLVYGLNF